MILSARQIEIIIGVGAISAPAIHILTDFAEWYGGGFSVPQLWINYTAFIVIPFLMVGLFAVQHKAISYWGLVGALLYGAAFVYFSHTSLYAIEEHVLDYESLWLRLGKVYTAHGFLMIVGGFLFGIASYQARFFPAWTSIVFLSGIGVNMVLGLSNVPDIFQIFGSMLRNSGLIGMGVFLVWCRFSKC